MKFSELKSHLLHNNLLNCYVIQGDDRYLVLWSKKLLTGKTELHEFNINTFNELSAPSDIISALETLPLMSDYRLIFLEDIKAIPDELIQYLKKPNPTSILAIIPKSGTIISRLPDNTEAVDCSPLDDNVLKAFIERETAQTNPLGISDEAAALLIEYCLHDMMRITTELEKLKLYCLERQISKDDIELMVTKDTDYKIYQFLEKLALKRSDEALNMLHSMGTEAAPLKIIAAIASHFRKLFQLKITSMNDESIARIFNSKVYALKYLRAQAALYSAMKLKEINDYIYEADYRIKTGRIKDSYALLNIIQKIV